MTVANPLNRLAERAREIGPPLETLETSASLTLSPYAELAAAGPRTNEKGPEYAFVVEAIREGYLCHYGSSRILNAPDVDLALLAGDLFYAIGISGLAELDDLESTGILSDLIRAAAELQATGRPDLAEQLWLAQVMALTCGKADSQEAALQALLEGDIEAVSGLREWSSKAADAHGLRRAFDNAQSAIDSRPSNS